MNSQEINEATFEELEARIEELMEIPNVETTFPEGMELQLIKQRIYPDFNPPISYPKLGGGNVVL